MKTTSWFLGLLLFTAIGAAQKLEIIDLPAPQTQGGKPLMEALKERRSSRSFASRKLPLQVLSNLLWAADGVNRPDGRRTVPSTMNWQEVDIYAAMQDGLFLYDPKGHRLVQVVDQDLRAATGTQGFVAEAPLNLVYVIDLARASGDEKTFYSAFDAAFPIQNVYLFCASEGLATVVRGSLDRGKLAPLMKLRPDQRITLSQTVGYPK